MEARTHLEAISLVRPLRRVRAFSHALRVTPLLEQKVTEGKITVAAASCVAAMLADPKMLRDEDDWIGWAEHETTKRIRQRVRRRREEARVGDEPVCPLSLFVRAKARDDFQRAREVASAKAGRALTPGETFETVVDHYLDTFDVDRVAPGQRRCPPTALVDGRYVPMAVRREIYERQGHECAVPFCGHSMFLEKAHLWAHASGGDREAENLVLLCSTHHWFLDRGSIKVVGTASKPQFFDSNGEDMAKRYEPGGSQSPSLRPTCKPTPAPTPTPTLKELDSRSGPPTRAADPPDSIERAASDPQPSSKPAPAIDPDRFGDPPRSAFTT